MFREPCKPLPVSAPPHRHTHTHMHKHPRAHIMPHAYTRKYARAHAQTDVAACLCFVWQVRALWSGLALMQERRCEAVCFQTALDYSPRRNHSKRCAGKLHAPLGRQLGHAARLQFSGRELVRSCLLVYLWLARGAALTFWALLLQKRRDEKSMKNR